MNKLKLPILFLVNLLFLIWPPKNLNSCGFTLYKEEYRFWTFDPNVSAQPGMLPLFYSMDIYHKGFPLNGGWNFESVETKANDSYEQNIKLWKSYLKNINPQNNVLNTDIYEILYNTTPTSYFSLLEGLKKENTFIKFIQNYPEILKYIALSKKAEYQYEPANTWECKDCPILLTNGKIHASERSYYYGEDISAPDPIIAENLRKEAEQNIQQLQDDFLKQRYAFQMVRLGFYTNDSALISRNFDKYLKPLPNSNWLKNSAIMYEVNKYTGAQKNYMLSKIFDACPDLRYQCEIAYQNDLTTQTLAYAQNNHERAMILVVDATHRPQEKLLAIEEIMHLDPKNDFLPGLWIREINKLEDWILGPQYCEFGSSRKEGIQYNFDWDDTEKINRAVALQLAKDKEYAHKVYASLNKNLNNLVRTNASFYQLCAGYISFILKNTNIAEKHFSLVQANDLNDLGKTQFLLCKFMLEVSKTTKISEQAKSDFASLYNYLRATANKHPQRKLMASQLINFVAKEFIARGAAPEGFLLYGFSSQPYASHNLIGLGNLYTQVYKYASYAQILEMINILDKPNPTELEKILKGQIYPYTWETYSQEEMEYVNKDKLLDLASMKMVQEDKLTLALETLKKIDTSYWSNEVYADFKKDDPFWVSPNNGQDPLNLRGVSYNKVSFLRELIQLKNQVPKLSNEKKALALYKIGNAYYSMSYHGKYWIMQKNYQMAGVEYDNDHDVTPEYYSANRSRYYFKEALKYCNEPKLLTLILFMFDHGYYEVPGKRTNIFPLQVFKEKKLSSNIYEQLSGNCQLFYELIETYN
jgi:hypothetical protein